MHTNLLILTNNTIPHYKHEVHVVCNNHFSFNKIPKSNIDLGYNDSLKILNYLTNISYNLMLY